jgi:ABC-type transport system involved in cytochrome c biogenesis permease subunit
MEPERLEAMVQAGVLSFVSILTTVLFITFASRAASGRLQRNQWIGIRTPSTMRSDRGWVAGHQAALRLAPLFLLTTIVTCSALFAVALYVSTPGVVRLLGFGVVAVIVVLVICSAFVAGNAAKSVDAHPDHPDRPQGQ